MITFSPSLSVRKACRPMVTGAAIMLYRETRPNSPPHLVAA